MKKIYATLRIVVPMFLGDAVQEPTSMRAPSIKGALRFWWRALNWSRCLSESDSNEFSALRLLHTYEAEIFGISTGDKEEHGQGVFLLSVSQQPSCKLTENRWPNNDERSSYLAYGLLPAGKVPYQRKGILEQINGSPNLFEVCLLFRPNVSDEKIKQVEQALHTWGLIGGLGGRSRRGFGSVAIVSINEQIQTFSTREAYETKILSLCNEADFAKRYPPFTAFSQLSKVKVLGTSRNPKTAMAELGEAYRNHRGQPSSLRGRVKVAFGLPLQEVDTKNRRSSPLFFHIHPIGNAQFVSVGLFLPAQFHFHEEYDTPNLDLFYAPVRSFVA